LYGELLRCFGIIGGYGECERLEKLWNDPVYNREMRRYIEAWVEFRKKGGLWKLTPKIVSELLGKYVLNKLDPRLNF
jgi:hypothetical protein